MKRGTFKPHQACDQIHTEAEDLSETSISRIPASRPQRQRVLYLAGTDLASRATKAMCVVSCRYRFGVKGHHGNVCCVLGVQIWRQLPPRQRLLCLAGTDLASRATKATCAGWSCRYRLGVKGHRGNVCCVLQVHTWRQGPPRQRVLCLARTDLVVNWWVVRI